MAQHSDSLQALFLDWRPRALRALLNATHRLLYSDFNLRTEGVFHQQPGLRLALPRLGWGDVATTHWTTALKRFAQASDATILHPLWSSWARAIVLGLLAMTHSMREMLFVDEPSLLAIRHARAPSTAQITEFLGFLCDTAFPRWSEWNYPEPEVFAAACASFYLLGDAEALHATHFVFRVEEVEEEVVEEKRTTQ